MASDPGLAGLEEFLAERGDVLLRAAVLLTGSREAGEDLLQAALERLLRHWPRLKGADPEGYLRRTIYHLAADGWRREGRRRVKFRLLRAAEDGVVADGSAVVDQRDELVRLLLQLPAGQRAAIVLRYWEELSEAEAADVLGCSEGTVKSAASHGGAGHGGPGGGAERADDRDDKTGQGQQRQPAGAVDGHDPARRGGSPEARLVGGDRVHDGGLQPHTERKRDRRGQHGRTDGPAGDHGDGLAGRHPYGLEHA
jgi:RNA polymerase sigma-70 factor (sigma-E family)